MRTIAFLQGVHDALAKFGASIDVPHRDWFLEPTTSPQGRSDSIRRAFNTNSELGRDSNMSQPSTFNPGPKYKTDMGSLGNGTDSMGGTGPS
jgi:hypothetical protein